MFWQRASLSYHNFLTIILVSYVMLLNPMSKDIAIGLLYEQQKSIIVLQILEPNRIARDYGIKNLIIELKVDE